MISLEELNEVKEKRKTNLYYEEKEYLQYVFLNSISRYKEFVFKGGTCLRICYGLERASEDLDFSSSLRVKEIKEIIKRCLKEFEYLNIPYKVYSEKEFEGNYRTEIRFEGPLFKGDIKSTNTLKIDFNKRKVKNKSAKVISKLFSDVPLFVLVALEEKEILAEKLRALINRAEPRDLYDLWILLEKGAEVDKDLINEKLKEENSKLENLKFPSRERYNLEMKNLVSVVPNYEQAVRDINKRLKDLS